MKEISIFLMQAQFLLQKYLFYVKKYGGEVAGDGNFDLSMYDPSYLSLPYRHLTDETISEVLVPCFQW